MAVVQCANHFGFVWLINIESGGRNKCNFWTARVKSTKNNIFENLSSRAFDWYMYGSDPRRGRGFWVPRGGSELFWGGLQDFSGPLLRNFKYIVGILSSSPVDSHPFWANWVKGGVCGHVQNSEAHAHTRSSAGLGVSQANEAAINLKLTGLCQHEIVSGIVKKWKQCGTVQASYGCLVGYVCMGFHIPVFAP